MHFTKTVAALFTFTLAATAVPTGPSNSGVNCPVNYQAKCCDSVQQSILNLIPINVGINCVEVISLSPKCNNVLACCQSGSQTGLVNIGNVCIPINA